MVKKIKFNLGGTKIANSEKGGTYSLNPSLFFNFKEISLLTVTDHGQISHSNIKIEVIFSLIIHLNNEILKPVPYSGERKIFKFEMSIEDKDYRLIFGFHDFELGHLGIRNCYQTD